MTTKERKDWVNNDEGLYRLWLASRKSITRFVRDHGETIDAVVARIRSGEERAHYLAYGARP